MMPAIIANAARRPRPSAHDTTAKIPGPGNATAIARARANASRTDGCMIRQRAVFGAGRKDPVPAFLGGRGFTPRLGVAPLGWDIKSLPPAKGRGTILPLPSHPTPRTAPRAIPERAGRPAVATKLE